MAVTVDTRFSVKALGAARRNAPCACGSGRRYKQCCGLLEAGDVPPTEGPLWEFAQLRLAALRHHRAGSLEQAEALYRRAIAIDDEDPDVLHMLGMVLHLRGASREALTLLRKAGTLSDWSLPGLFKNLGLVIGARVAGRSATRAVRLRAAAADFTAQREARRKPVRPLVSVVVPSYNHARYLPLALESVFRQSYRHLELIVIDDGSTDRSPEVAAKILSDAPLPSSLIVRENRGAPATINDAVRLSRGEYINVLNSDDCFLPTRIEEMVEEIAGVGADWGFSAVSCMDADALPLKATADARAAWIEGAADTIRQSDTIGSALLSASNVAVSTGNLFFSRALFDRLEGFSDYRYNHDWDFCLRALWHSEPCFVPNVLYRYRLHAGNTIRESSSGTQAEATRIFSAYHAVAMNRVPTNPLAPSRHVLGDRYGVELLAQGGGETFPRSALIDLAARLDTDESAETPADLPAGGLNVMGFVRGEFGLGISVRALARACLDHNLPVCLLDADVQLGSRQAERSMDGLIADEPRYRDTLVYMNPDLLKGVWERVGGAALKHCRKIGYWYWELERFPRKWNYALDLVDEIWVASEFVRAAIAGATDKPVIKIPHSINVPLSRAYARREFGLPEGPFLFLVTFDFNSYAARKNPAAAIFAFRKAFSSGLEDVRLVVKCAHGRLHPAEVDALNAVVGSDPRIIVLDTLLEMDALRGLQSLCDAYVSLHRSEGLGLGMAECMAFGKAVIATAYSGNLEFMTGDNSCLVDFRMVPVQPGEYIDYEDEWFWADADVEHAAHFMRKVVADDEFRSRIGRNAQRDIETNFSDAVTVREIRRRLAELDVIAAA